MIRVANILMKMKITQFLNQFWRVFIVRNWNWSKEGVPDKLTLYEPILRVVSFHRSVPNDGRYQLCVIGLMLFHAARLGLCCMFGTKQWYDKWLWADIGTAFGDRFRTVLNLSVAYGYLGTAIMIVTHYCVSQSLHHSSRTPWYSGWSTFLTTDKLPHPTGCYLLAETVLLWKIAFISQLVSLLLSSGIAMFVTLFTTHSLLHDFPFGRPYGEIYAILFLNMLWIILYAVSLYLAFMNLVCMCNALVCQSLSYSLRVKNITLRLRSSFRFATDIRRMRHTIGYITDMQSVTRELVSQKFALDAILGMGIAVSLSVALFWLYIAIYLAIDFYLVMLSYSILSAALVNAGICTCLASLVSYSHDHYVATLFCLNVRIPLRHIGVKRLICKTLRTYTVGDLFTLSCWICFPINRNTLIEVSFTPKGKIIIFLTCCFADFLRELLLLSAASRNDWNTD